jgi:hypothetical protein
MEEAIARRERREKRAGENATRTQRGVDIDVVAVATLEQTNKVDRRRFVERHHCTGGGVAQLDLKRTGGTTHCLMHRVASHNTLSSVDVVDTGRTRTHGNNVVAKQCRMIDAHRDSMSDGGNRCECDAIETS